MLSSTSLHANTRSARDLLRRLLSHAVGGASDASPSSMAAFSSSSSRAIVTVIARSLGVSAPMSDMQIIHRMSADCVSAGGSNGGVAGS